MQRFGAQLCGAGAYSEPMQARLAVSPALMQGEAGADDSQKSVTGSLSKACHA